VLYGSEQAAVKAALGKEVPPSEGGAAKFSGGINPAFRLDLDDLGRAVQVDPRLTPGLPQVDPRLTPG